MQRETQGLPLSRFLQIAVLLFAAALLVLAPLAFAEGENPEGDAAQAEATKQATEAPAESTEAAPSDAQAASESTSSSASDIKVDVDGLAIGKDVFLANDSLVSSGAAVPANLFAAGSSVDISKAEVGADAFVAGQDVTLDNVTVGNNLFVAGNTLTVSNSTMGSLFIAGNNLNIDSDMENLIAAGTTVFLKGSFGGNVSISATNVIIDPYIEVKGELNVTAESEPTIASTAKIGSYNYNQIDTENSYTTMFNFSSIGSSAWLWNLLMMFLGMLLLGVVILLLLRTEVIDASGALVKQRPLAIFVTGLLTIILLPIVIVLLFLTIVGWTVAIGFIFIFSLVTIFAGTYTAISLGRTVLPRVNKWITSILFIAVFALLLCVPIANTIIGFLSLVYFTGLVVQGWWVWRRNKVVYPQPGDDDFMVPRGSHATPPEEQAIPPIPATSGIPSVDPADYQPRTWN